MATSRSMVGGSGSGSGAAAAIAGGESRGFGTYVVDGNGNRESVASSRDRTEINNDIDGGGGVNGVRTDSVTREKDVRGTMKGSNNHVPASISTSTPIPTSTSTSTSTTSSGKWYRLPHLLRLNLLLLSLLQLSSTNGYDGSLLNSLQALPQWQTFMHNPTGAWLGFVIAIQSLGQLSMYPFVSWLVQHHGRKKGIYAGYVWLTIGIAVQVSARDVAAFIVARFFVGAATAMWFGSVPLLITEVAFPGHRGVCTSLWNCGWFCGTVVAAWVTYGTRNYDGDWAWRLPSLLQVVLPCVAVPGAVLLPESPRFLVAVGRRGEALDVLVRWHAGGDGASEVVIGEMREIEEAICREEMAMSGKGRVAGYLELFRGRGNRWRSFITVTLGFLAQWNGVGIVQYYLVLVLKTAGVTGVTEQTLISGFLQVWNLICAVTGALLVNRVGRKKLFNFSNVAMLLCFVLITALSGTFASQGNKAAGIAVIPFLFLYYGAYDLAWNPLIFAYTVEIWPYSLRAKGLSLCLISTSFALLFNTFVNPIALASIGWRYYIVYIVILLITTVICWLFYPETRGHTLEQMAVVFDGDKADLTLEREKAIGSENGNLSAEP